MKKKLLSLSAILLGGLSFGQTILLEDFESGLPVTWTQTTAATDGGYLAGNSTSLSSTSLDYGTTNASNFVSTNDDACNCTKNADRLISPSFSLASVSGAFLAVDLFFYKGTYQNQTESAKIEVSTDGGTTWTTLYTLVGAGDWWTKTLNLSAYLGQSNVKISFLYNDKNKWMWGLAIDNFNVYTPSPSEVAMTSFNMNPYYFNTANNVRGVVTNYGYNNITSLTIDWNDGTSHPQTFNVNIAPLATYTFIHSTAVSVPSLQTTTINVTASIPGDVDMTNNDLSDDIYGLSYLPATVVVGEEGTGTWCGYCPGGAVMMEQLATDFPTSWAGVAVHNADPMKVTAYDNAVSALISGYPSGLVDRAIIDVDPYSFDSYYAQRMLIHRPAGVTVTNGWNPSTRVLSATVTAEFAITKTVNWRLAAIVVEDDVTGTTSGYAQTNYFSGGSLGNMGGYENLPDPVPASQMVYDHVGRYLMGGFNGQAATIPSSVTSGSTASYTFNYTLPATYDESKIKVIGIIIDQTTGEIVNAGKIQISLGMEETNDAFEFKLFPNPTEDLTNIRLNLKEEGDVQIDIYNIAGKLINSNNYGTMSGTKDFTLDASGYESGVYFVNVTVNGSVLSKKMIVTH